MLEILAGAVLAVALPAAIQWARRTRANRRDVQAIRDVVCGTTADPIRGRPSTPGVAERLGALEHALSPLGGLADRVTRLEADMAAHLRTHGGSSS